MKGIKIFEEIYEQEINDFIEELDEMSIDVTDIKLSTSISTTGSHSRYTHEEKSEVIIVIYEGTKHQIRELNKKLEDRRNRVSSLFDNKQ